MKRLKTFAFLLIGSLSVPITIQAQVASLKSGEYWIDQQFDQRKSISIQNGWQTQLDVSALTEGIHTISFRASDTKGRWSAPIIRYFLRTVPSHEGNVPTTYEYWTDGDFAKRTSGALVDGVANLQIDYSNLPAGMHAFYIRVGDNYGQWSAPRTRFFLIPTKEYSNNKLVSYKYWIDGNYDLAVSGAMDESGTINLQLNTKELCKGLHTLSYQVSDRRGKVSAPIVRYFVIPEPALAGNKIGAYEYWFNAGPRVHVDVEPVNPLEIKDLVIEIKDVVPNEIPSGYRFDTGTETVYCDDNVTFGIAAYDQAGNSSIAALSDTFRITVPVKPDFIDLANGETTIFEAPSAGRISGFRMNAATGDSLKWTIGGVCKADFYDSNGTPAEIKTSTDEEGKTIYTMKATTSTTYALVHHASVVFKEMDITCARMSTAGIHDATCGFTFRTSKSRLSVTASHNGRIKVTNITGVTVIDKDIHAGTSDMNLPTGIYLLQWENKTVQKILIP